MQTPQSNKNYYGKPACFHSNHLPHIFIYILLLNCFFYFFFTYTQPLLKLATTWKSATSQTKSIDVIVGNLLDEYWMLRRTLIVDLELRLKK